MAVANYTDLQAAIASYLVRDDLSDLIPTFIALFESKFSRTMRLSEMETVTTLTPASDGTVNVPTDFAEMRYVQANASPGYMLEALTPAVSSYRSSQSGTARGYYVQAGKIVTAPISQYGLTIGYYAKLPALSATNATNWLLTKYPDAYLYGSLAEASAFQMDDKALARWQAMFQGVMQDIRSADGARWNAGAVSLSVPCP
jgi:hypothetical protein